MHCEHVALLGDAVPVRTRPVAMATAATAGVRRAGYFKAVPRTRVSLLLMAVMGRFERNSDVCHPQGLRVGAVGANTDNPWLVRLRRRLARTEGGAGRSQHLSSGAWTHSAGIPRSPHHQQPAKRNPAPDRGRDAHQSCFTPYRLAGRCRETELVNAVPRVGLGAPSDKHRTVDASSDRQLRADGRLRGPRYRCAAAARNALTDPVTTHERTVERRHGAQRRREQADEVIVDRARMHERAQHRDVRRYAPGSRLIELTSLLRSGQLTASTGMITAVSVAVTALTFSLLVRVSAATVAGTSVGQRGLRTHKPCGGAAGCCDARPRSLSTGPRAGESLAQ